MGEKNEFDEACSTDEATSVDQPASAHPPSSTGYSSGADGASATDEPASADEPFPLRDKRSLGQIIADGDALFGIKPGSDGQTPTGDAPARALPRASSPEREEPPVNPTIPPAFRWANLDVPELRQRVQRARVIDQAQTAAVTRGSLLISGPSGSGKTSLACAMLRAWDAAHPGRPGVFMSAWKLGIARAQYGLGQGEAPEVERAMTTRLLVLDDLGSERSIATNAVPDVIFERALAGLPTWVTTWMTAALVAQRYGDGIARRLHEAGQVTAVVCGEAQR